MSAKRQAPNELNHENWDQEDSAEQEEMGTFKTASKEVLEKRVIRTAKRRSQVSSDEPKKSVFSGFGGFNKIQQSSFDFLANLTNGSKINTAQPTTKNDTAVSSSIFGNTPIATTAGTGIFSMSGSSGFATKPTLGKSPEGSPFGGSAASNTSPIQSIFTSTKADSTVSDSPFKLQPSPATDSISKPSINPDVSTSQVSSTIFGAPSNSSPNKSLFSSKTSNSTLFSAQAVSSTSTTPLSSATTTKADSNTAETSTKSSLKEEKKQTYFTKLKGLNESVSDWIKKHVEKTPLCILSPIFKDYERYLKEIQDEYNGGEPGTKKSENKTEPEVQETKTPANNNVNSSVFSNTNNTGSSVFGKTNNANSSVFGNTTNVNSGFGNTNNVNSGFGNANNVNSSVFGNLTSTNVPKVEASPNNKSDVSAKSSSFSFGINTSTTTMANTGFSFGINPSTPSTASSLFSVNTTTTTNAGTPFSFGINKSGFGFNATSPPKTETVEAAKDEDDEPPKVEFTPVVEENSVFDKKCKIFIKKDGNFVDKGVGTLYIKKIEESGKHQLLVRANTNLGSVLLNLILSSSIPTQRMGKNNVMLVCIPTPDAKPPPTPILIRVKTTEEADELLSLLNKYKA